MNWKEILKLDGIGIIGTADRDGNVNLAIYSPPQIIGEDRVVFGATARKTYENLMQNPKAMFMYIVKKWEGIRMELELQKVEAEGEMLKEIKQHFKNIGYDKLAEEIRYALYFKVTAVYPLKGR